MYSPTANIWTSLAPLPITVEEAHATATTNGQMYVFSGISNNAWITDVYRYNPDTHTWTSMASLPAPLYKGSVSYDGSNTIYAASSAGPLYTYNIARDHWTTQAPLPISAQYQASGVTSDGAYITAGGSGTSDAQRYTMATNSWTAMTPNPEILRDGGGIVTPNGTIYTMGQGYSAYIPFLETYVATSTSATNGGAILVPGTATPELNPATLVVIGLVPAGLVLARRRRVQRGRGVVLRG